MHEESPLDIAIDFIVAGIAVWLFLLFKLGGIEHLLSGRGLPENINQQMQTEELDVDPALLDEPHPNHPESRAPSSKSDTLE